MKTIKRFTFATLATVAALAAALLVQTSITQADGQRGGHHDQRGGDHDDDDRGDRDHDQTAEILLLLTAVHEVTSYNGDADTRSQHLAAMSRLWAKNATFVINNTTTHTGRDAIMTFFAGAGFFNNNWVGLTPSFRTEVDIHGNTAEVYLECIFVDEAKTVVLERSLSGTVRKVRGQWLFWRMNSDPATPLFP